MEMPTSNPSWFLYEKDQIKKNIAYMIKYADVVTVSTEFLGQKLIALNPNIVVIQNGFDMDMFPYRSHNAGERTKSFFWRGSPTHHKDVMTFADEVVAAAEELPDWKFHFIADNLWFLTDRMNNEQAYVMEAQTIEKYHAHIWRIKPSACFVPLHECAFNRAKSNIAYLESAFAGGVTIAPDWEEWRHPGVLLYKDQKSFHEAFRVVAKGQIDVVKQNQIAWEYIGDNFSLNKMNQRRRQVFERLVM
jgi:hypothetical protein